MSWDEWHPDAETLVKVAERTRDGLALTSLAGLVFLGARLVGRWSVAGLAWAMRWERP